MSVGFASFLILDSFLFFNYICMYNLCKGMYTRECDAHTAQKRVTDALQLELQVIVNCLMEVLGTELWFSAIGVHAFTC